MAHKGRGHRLDIIRVTAVHMIKVQLPRDGRANGRGRAKTPERRGRKVGWPDHLGLGQIIKKTARPSSITIVIRSGQFAISFPFAIAADGSGNRGCADEIWRDPLLEKKGVLRLFVSDLVLELARWETPLPRESGSLSCCLHLHLHLVSGYQVVGTWGVPPARPTRPRGRGFH